MIENFKNTKAGLLPAIIQDAETKQVLMLGYMNIEAYEITLATKKVTFYSRSKRRIWTKGEQSGNVLYLKQLQWDCDNDTLLLQVQPAGPTCHTGNDTCWQNQNIPYYGFVSQLEETITKRLQQTDNKNSYIAQLFEKGINKIAQKVGEEAVEMVIEAKDDNTDLFLNESADLLFHYLLLLKAKGFEFNDVISILKTRQKL